MGEMILRNLDHALLVELNRMAELRGVDVDALAADLLRQGLHPAGGRAAEARAIQALQPRPSPLDSVDLIREDRNRG